MIRITLPFPVSVNAMYAGKGRRYKSKRYAQWLSEAAYQLSGQRFEPITKRIPLQATYRFVRTDNRVRDLANYLKPIDDFLVSQGLIPDDRWIHRGIFEWWNMSLSPVTVEIVPLP